MKQLTRQEITECEVLFSKLCEAPENALQELNTHFENAEEILHELEIGVDNFYQLYETDDTAESLRQKLENNMIYMTPTQRYSYLANIIVAMTHACGTLFEGEEWNVTLKTHEQTLSALELGLITEESEQVQTEAEEMMAMICDGVEQFSLLFLQNPDFERLHDACMTEDLSKVEALASNTRQASVNMAAALYILHKEGKLPSLGDDEITAQDMGTMSATLLEIDAAQKTGSWETAKEIAQKAIRVATTLLISSPALLTGGAILTLVAALTHFSILWLLISTAILTINIRVYFKALGNQLEGIFQTGAKYVNTTLDKSHEVYQNVSDWTQKNIMPKAYAYWKRLRKFTVDHILVPCTAFLLKAKERILLGANGISEKWNELLAKLKENSSTIFEAAEEWNRQQEEANDMEDMDIEDEFFEEDVAEVEKTADIDDINVEDSECSSETEITEDSDTDVETSEDSIEMEFTENSIDENVAETENIENISNENLV